jgi:hypothetical protein
MATPTTFRDVNQELGHDYEDYCANMYAVALSDPGTYYKMKALVKKKISREVVKTLHDTITGALTTDLLFANSNIAPTAFPLVAQAKVSYPYEKSRKLALDISSSLDEYLNEVVAIIMPDDFDDVASKRILKKAKASI